MAKSERLGLTAYQRAIPAVVQVCALLNDFESASRYLARARISGAPTKELNLVLQSASWLALRLGARGLSAQLAGLADHVRARFAAPPSPYELFRRGQLTQALAAALPATELQAALLDGEAADALELVGQVLQLRLLTDSMGPASAAVHDAVASRRPSAR